MTGSLPVFGPTGAPVADEDVDGLAVVRLAVILSCAHLRTALAAAYAELGDGRALSDLTVAEIRQEVEGHLGANALLQLYRETDTAEAHPATPDRARWLAALDDAITRAYTAPAPPERPVQAPRYGDGTVTLATEDHGDVTLDEPTWCAGHADHRPDTYRVDLDHKGPEHRLHHHGEVLWTAFLGQAPFASRPEHRGIGVYIEQGAYARTLEPAGLYDLAATLDAHADQLRELADQLATLLGGDR